MLEITRYVLWGSAGHAKVLASLINLRGGIVVALFDNDPQAEPALSGVPLYFGLEGLKRWADDQATPHSFRGIAAIGGARGRERVVIHQHFRDHGIQVTSLIHPSASVCGTASIGHGTQVLAHALVAADACVGEACILNHRAAADHECVLGNGVHLAPASTLCGCVEVGDNVLVGAGAVVLPRLVIGKDTIIGAGAVVTRNIPEGVVVAGNPARMVRINVSKSP
ncbi:acetyltransferase [Candidatus Thiodictyon syntrophicum]|jgi:sugar O-acyltransferase (sialic acid O-acetyltransferase NeuD family)|uniref:PglD N-terminal domain-containing protein n=1 Tax=Candidatus Thiodictyon syntrophicum TaxID=1166950 RepID=A0A2K8UF08_9GAMM|nr:acetyltransferase [Candidatus Thiodictyon syntrophicum]AUB84164.1 hypothetical protein THSYN_26640 [Candidatus Thiodictyon syntrophicum]